MTGTLFEEQIIVTRIFFNLHTSQYPGMRKEWFFGVFDKLSAFSASIVGIFLKMRSYLHAYSTTGTLFVAAGQ